jgi:hypothetical protein
MNISICNAQLHLTGYIEKICCFSALQMLILSAADLQIRQDEEIPQRSAQPPARRRLQPTSEIKAKLQLCTLGYAERKNPVR